MTHPTNPTNPLNSAQQIQTVTGLKPQQFADLVRIAQLIDDPANSVAGRVVEVDWASFGVPPAVVDNLKGLGMTYRHASPYVAIEQVWQQLTPETRNWLFENRNDLWRLEEILPALDED